MEYRLVLVDENGKEGQSWLMDLDKNGKVKFVPSRKDIKKAILEHKVGDQIARGLCRVSYNG